jgi:hypothetical protein
MENNTDLPPGFPTKVSLVGVYLTVRNYLLSAAWIEAMLETWHWRREGNYQLARKWKNEWDAMDKRLKAFSDEFKETYSLYQRAEFCWFIHQTKSFHLAWENLESTANSCYYAIVDQTRPAEEVRSWMKKVKRLKNQFEQVAQTWLEKHPAEIYLDEVRDPLEDLVR